MKEFTGYLKMPTGGSIMTIIKVIETEIKKSIGDKETRELAIKMLLTQNKSEMKTLIDEYVNEGEG